MLDPKLISADIEKVAQKLARRGFTLDVAGISALEEERKTVQVETQNLQNEKNQNAKAIGKAKANGEDIQPLLDAVANLGDQLKAKESQLDTRPGGGVHLLAPHSVKKGFPGILLGPYRYQSGSAHVPGRGTGNDFF